MENLPINGLDLAVIAVIVISGLLAFARGFIHEALSVGSWVAAAAVVVFALPYARPYARDFITVPILADLAAAGVIFIVAVLCFSIVIGFITDKVQGSSLGPIDRTLGFLFGLARGALLVCLAYLPLQWLAPPAQQPDWLKNARVLPWVQSGADWLKSLIGEDLVPPSGPRKPTTTQDSSRETARKALETEKMVRDMMSPNPKSPPAPDSGQPKGYGDRERRELERLIGGER